MDLDFIDKQAHEPEPSPEPPVPQDTLTAGSEIKMDINFGYFKTVPNVEVVSKSANNVTFIIPFGINTLTITTKDPNKLDIVRDYNVR